MAAQLIPPLSFVEATKGLQNHDITATVCHALHRWVRSLPRFRYPYQSEAIPANGVYFIFENGEAGHDGDRIVRIGSHTGADNLSKRLEEHFVNENKERSIFRKHIGSCLLNRDKDDFLRHWKLDLTSRKARDQYQGIVDPEKQAQTERSVSMYIRNNLSFAYLAIAVSKAERLGVESKLISCLSLCNQCKPSKSWLGHHSIHTRIVESGIWHVQGLYKMALALKELRELMESAE